MMLWLNINFVEYGLAVSRPLRHWWGWLITSSFTNDGNASGDHNLSSLIWWFILQGRMICLGEKATISCHDWRERKAWRLKRPRLPKLSCSNHSFITCCCYYEDMFGDFCGNVVVEYVHSFFVLLIQRDEIICTFLFECHSTGRQWSGDYWFGFLCLVSRISSDRIQLATHTESVDPINADDLTCGIHR